MFSLREYPLGVSLMSDIIRHNALGNPFWITELQGGNVTASGNVPYCPTAAHTAQYLWTAIASGAEGVIFWSLNQRAAVMEAGEWGGARLPAQALGPYARSREGRIGIAASRRRVSGVEAYAGSGDAPL